MRPGVRFGKPLDFSRYYGLHEDRIVLRAITDEIMYELMKLAGQEYVDEYAQRNKLRRGSSRRNQDPAISARAGGADGAARASADGGPPATAPGAGATADGGSRAAVSGLAKSSASGVARGDVTGAGAGAGSDEETGTRDGSRTAP